MKKPPVTAPAVVAQKLSTPWPFHTPERAKLLDVWPHQYDALELCRSYPIVAMHGSVQNGKSQWLNLAGVQRVVHPASQPPAHSDRVFWVTVPTRAPYWHNFQPVFEKVWGWERDGGMILDRNETLARYIIKAADGGKPWTCWVRYADKPDTFRTASPDFILATEAALYKPEIFALMQFRVAKMNGPIFMDTSPNGLGWFWKLIIDRAALTLDFRPTITGGDPLRMVRSVGADPRIALVNGVPITANRFMKAETLQVMKENMSSEEWRREGLGEAFASSGLVLFAFDPRKHIVKKLGLEAFSRSGSQWHIIEGIDYGFTDSTAKVTLAVNDGRYLVVDEYEEGGMSLSAHAERWKGEEWFRWVKWRYDDPSLPLARAELGEHGIGITQGNNDVEAGINKLNHLFERGRLLVMDHCIKTIDAIGVWQRNKKTGRPEHPRDVLAALRYPVLTHSLAYDGRPIPSGYVEGDKVKWKLPSGEVVETTREAETKDMMTEEGIAREIV